MPLKTKLELTAGAFILVMVFMSITFIKENTIYNEETLTKEIEKRIDNQGDFNISRY